MPSPAPAPQMQQPPMRGAAQSVGRAPQQEQRAPQRAPQQAPQRAQGRFNPMQGPMGAGMDRARQAAATMFMDRAPKPMQPSMPQQPKTPPPAMPQAMPQSQMQPAAQSAMQQAGKMPAKAPASPQTTQRVSQRMQASPEQEAAIGMFGPMFARSGDVPNPDDGFGSPGTDDFIDQEEKIAEAMKGGKSMQDLMGLDSAEQQLIGDQQSSFDDQSVATPPKVTQIPSEMQGEHLTGPGYIDTDGDGLADIYVSVDGVGVGGNVAPDPIYDDDDEDRRPFGISEEDFKELVESGQFTGTGTGTGTDPDLMGALEQAILDLLDDESEGIYSEDELKAQVDALKKDAAEAKQDLAMKMAMRGMGASGLAGAGFGNIDAQLIDTINDLALQNKALGIERDLKKLGISGPLLANLLNNETRRMIAEREFDYRAEEDKKTNESIFLNNLAAEFGAEKWDPASSAEVTRLMNEGVEWWRIRKLITVSPSGTAFFTGTPGQLTGDGMSGFDKQTTDDWGSSVMNVPGLYEEESEDIDKMFDHWKQTASNPDKFNNAQDWLSYYFSDPPNLDELQPYEREIYKKQRREANRSLLYAKGLEFAPPGFETIEDYSTAGEERVDKSWINLTSIEKAYVWDLYDRGYDPTIYQGNKSDLYDFVRSRSQTPPDMFADPKGYWTYVAQVIEDDSAPFQAVDP